MGAVADRFLTRLLPITRVLGWVGLEAQAARSRTEAKIKIFFMVFLLSRCFHDVPPGATDRGTSGDTVGLMVKIK